MARPRGPPSKTPSLAPLDTALVAGPAAPSSGTLKGKARAALSRPLPPAAGSTPPSVHRLSRARLDPIILSDAGSDRDPVSRPASVANQPDSPVLATHHHPPHSAIQPPRIALDDGEDDGVEPIDRGEALVRRRMKERLRLKKEAERRQRRLDDDSSRVRPTASRTRTAPAPFQRPQTVQATDLTKRVSEAFNSLGTHPGRDHAVPRSDGTARSVSHHAPASTTAPGRHHPADHSESRVVSGPARSGSPEKTQSTYQSFGSPSQFTSSSFKASGPVAAPNSPSASTHLARARLAKTSLSSLVSRAQPDSHAEGSISELEGESEEDEDEFQAHDVREASSEVQTPVTRGRSRQPPSGSMRSPVSAPQQSATFESPIRSKSAGGHPSVCLAETQIEEEDEDEPAQKESDENAPLSNVEEETSENGSSHINDEDVEYTLKDRQDAINIEHPFGLPIWKPALYKKSRSVARNAEAALHDSPTSTSVSTLNLGNLLWALILGSPLAFVFALMAAILFVIPWGGSKYGRVVWELAGYLIWPFGKYVEEWSEEEEGEEGSEGAQEDGGPDRLGIGASRWEAVSDIGDNDNDSVDRLTIRGNVHERTALTAFTGCDRLKLPPNYGTAQATAAKPAASPNKQQVESSVSTDLMDMLGNAASKKGTSTPNQPLCQQQTYRQIRVRALGRLSFWTVYYLIIAPMMLGACLLCWFFVFPIPMAKLLWVLVRHVGTEPLALHFRSPPTFIDLHQVESGKAGLPEQRHPMPRPRPDAEADEARDDFGHRLPPQLKPGQPAPKHSKKSLSASRAKGRLVSGKAKVLLCTYKALGLQYYKYTIDGVNIIFIILMPIVIFVIFDFFFLAPLKLTGILGHLSSQVVLFVMALLSVVPLSYFIGMAVASISAQSSIGMGAVINATFGSIIEILLYGVALAEGKGDLVEGSIIGSVLAGVLLMPGMSMIGGSVRRKEQKFNARSAGVTSTMLIMAIIGALTPTLFYEIYGTFQLNCSGCPDGMSAKPGEFKSEALWQCKACRYEHISPVDDEFYQTSVKGLSYYCAILLVLSYLIGLWFSLRTHASQIWQTPAAGSHAVDHTHPLLPTSHGEHELSGSTNQQRMSMYVRKLPEIVKQQLLPHIQKSPTTISHLPGEHRASEYSFAQPPQSSAKPNVDENPLVLERTLTAEEVDRTIKVLEMATASHLSSTSRARALKHRLSSTHSLNRSRSHPTSQPAHHYHADVSLGPVMEPDGSGGHDAPNWSRTKSTTVLLSCTLLYAIIAEILVSVVDVVLNGSGIPEKLLGVTLFALVPNTTEFMNAISFAMNGNIALSMEIGSAYALQVCLIQIPAMIAISAFYNSGKTISAHHAFTLVFPRWDVISIIFSVFLLTYTYIEARANYHRGTILVLSYLVLVGGFYSAPIGSSMNEGGA